MFPVSAVLAIVAVVIAAVVCGQSALLSNPGPESGMVLAVVGGLSLALSQAARSARRERDGFIGDMTAALVIGAVMTAVFLIATTIGAAVMPSCSANTGRVPMLIVSLPVLWLQAAVGAIVGRATGKRRRAIAVVVVVEIAVAALIAVDVLDNPGFRAASHFFVVISGDLLAGASLPLEAIAFRTATALLALTVTLAGFALWPAHKTRGLVSGTVGGAPVMWTLTALCMVAFVFANSSARGALVVDRAQLDDAYTYIARADNLVVHANPLSTTPRDVAAILAEAALWRARLTARLGPLSSDDIHIYLHANRSEMAHYTGAVHVDFAMPWRRELHINSAVVPHRSLGHELAHIVAGERADTFLRVPSRFILLHNAAVTEGTAMALTPELAVHDGLTLREQAAAMRRTGRAPKLANLFSLMRFFGEEPGRAYTAAGALVEAIIADAETPEQAQQVLASLYQKSGALSQVTDDVDALIARHERALDVLPLPKDAAGFAAARYKRPSVLDAVCEPSVREVATAVRAHARKGELDLALKGVRALDGDDADGTLSSLLNDVRDIGHTKDAITLLRRLVELSPSPSERAVRELALGVELWRDGSEREAHAVWHRIDVPVMVVDLQRQVRATLVFADEAIRLGERAPMSRAALLFFIADNHTREGARIAFGEAVGMGSVDESDGVKALARYVLGRQLVQQGALAAGLSLLRPLIASPLLPEGFDDQTALAVATALVRSNDGRDEAREVLLAAADRATRPAVRLHLRDRAERASTDPLLLGAWPDGSF